MSTRYSKSPFVSPDDENTRLTIVLDNKGIQYPRLEDSNGNVIANYSGTTSIANPDGSGWLPIDGSIKVGDQGINEYLTTNSKGLNQVTTSAIKNLTADEQAKYKELETFPLEKNTQKSIQGFLNSSTAIRNVDIPKDPEGFFIGRYPLNQKDTDNFDYLRITCYDYEPGLMQGSSNNAFKIDDIDNRVKKRRGVVSLPIQPGISESNSVDWGDDQLSPLQIAGAQIAGQALDAGANAFSGQGFDISGLINSVAGTGAAALGALDENLIKAYFAQQAIGANIIGRSTGLTINNNLEVLFNGPQLRTFNYNYRFTPREPKEADKIKQIIRFFKKSMAPKRSTSRIFLKSPDVFKLKYTFKNGDSHPFLNNIKICALNGFTVDYTPDGSYSTYDDDGGRGDGSMTSYQVGLSFKEITPIYNDDFWNDDEGKEGTGF